MPPLYYFFAALMCSHAIFALSSNAGEPDISSAHQYYFQGQPEKAVESYKNFFNTQYSTISRLNASIVLQELGRNAEAINILENALEVTPTDSFIRSSLAWAYLFEGEFSKAKFRFLNNMAGKENVSSRDLLGITLAEIGTVSYPDALAHLKELQNRYPHSALPHYYMGRIHEERRMFNKAIASYEAALKEDSHFVEVRLFLAVLFERQGQIDDAWKQYAKITLMDPQHKIAKEKKEMLTSLLTKKPAEILGHKQITAFTPIHPTADRENIPEIRIGIGVSAGGSPVPRNRISFRTAAPFELIDLKTGKTLFNGDAKTTWTLRVSSTQADTAEIIDSQGKPIAAFKNTAVIRHKNPEKRTFIINEMPYGSGMSWSGVSDKELRGDIEFIIDTKKHGILIVNVIPIEEYLYGVLAAEMPAHWPLEALKAQAVIARTYAVYNQKILAPHTMQGYDLCDEQHCQVYTGISVENTRVRSAVDATKGEILVYNDKPAHTVFSSNCGGYSQSGTDIGWASLPYWQPLYDGNENSRPLSPVELNSWLKTIPDVYCKTSKYTWAPEFRWTRVILAKDLENKVSGKHSIGKIKRLVPFKRARSGHVMGINVIGTAGNLVINKEHEIRRILGLGPLRSTLFTVETYYEKDIPQSFIIYGGGWGHGVGMCQSGAAGRAETGISYKRILEHYYPGAILKNQIITSN